MVEWQALGAIDVPVTLRAAVTSAVRRASLIMNSRPPNTDCAASPESMSESLSSDSTSDTTTALCLGSWKKTRENQSASINPQPNCVRIGFRRALTCVTAPLWWYERSNSTTRTNYVAG